ncbi:MAG: aspartate/glutamate racemase family protein [Desulfovibrionaceae bacterium]|nr:aspartate/glutamate racemase family protein [Desulfovibrionaceae bacterium]
MGNWDNYPQNDEVHWPSDEKILGILGVAPLATIDFLQRCYARTVKKDWEHIRILVDSNPKIPSRGRCLELGETSPVPFMRAGIDNLAKNGAQVVAVPCNTAHIFYESYAQGCSVFLPNIITVTADACVQQKCRRALVLASRNVIEHNLYGDALSKRGIEGLSPDEAGQKIVSQAITTVKQIGYDNAMAHKLRAMIESYHTDAVILGCTELPILVDSVNSMKKIVDSTQELANRCLELCGIKVSLL